MRIEVTFSAYKKIVIPIQYNYHVQGMIYNNISDELATFLHGHGFMYGKRSFKLFCFSRLKGKFKIRKDGKIEFFPPIKLVITSPIERFLQEFAESMLKNDDLNLCGQRIFVKGIEILPTPKISDEEIKIKMQSPVVCYSSVNKELGQKTFYFSPWDEWFSELLSSNLKKKYKLITGQEEKLEDVQIIPTVPRNKKYCKVVNYKGTVIKGWMGIYKLRGDKRLLEVAYDAGLGAKNPQGFGCFKLI